MPKSKIPLAGRLRLVALLLSGALPSGALVAPDALAQPDVVVPGENLVVDGIPSLPAALAEQVGRYTEFRSASFQSWHPTLREMLISTRFGQTSQVHWVKRPAATAAR